MRTLWSYLNLADRETLASGFLSWLLDPRGDHGLGSTLLDELANAAGFSVEDTEAVTIARETSGGNRRRFDIHIEEAGEPVAALELKCKTAGSAAQLEGYDEILPHVVRVAYGEWNFPELSESDRERFPLVTFAELADCIERAVEEKSSDYELMLLSFARHLREETRRFQDLKSYYVTEEIDQLPTGGGGLPLGNRFTNRLLWRWFVNRVEEDRPDLSGDWTCRSESSGVWCSGTVIRLRDGEREELPELGITLEGPLKASCHFEIQGSGSLFGPPDEEVGEAILRIQGESSGEQRRRLYRQCEAATDELEDHGFRPSRRRPSTGAGYWSALRRPLSREELRYSELVRIAELFHTRDQVG